MRQSLLGALERYFRLPRLLVVMVVVFGLILTACGGDPTDTTSGESTETTSGESTETTSDEPSGDPDRVLRVVVSAEPQTFDVVDEPYTTLARVTKAILEPMIFTDTLTGALTKEGLIIDWERTSELEWLLTFREGVTFHDGQPFNAEVAARTVLQYRDHPIPNFAISPIAEATVTEDGKLLVTTSRPAPEVPALFAYMYAVPDDFDSHNLDAFNAHPVGTGPFKFVSRQEGQSIITEANLDYWRGAPAIAGIEFTFSAEPATRGALVQTGDADIALDMPFTQLGQYEDAENYRIESADGWFNYFLFFDGTVEPFSNVELRRAAQLAVDKQALVDFYGGEQNATIIDCVFACIGNQNWQPATWGLHDPDEARRIVDEEGGATITLSYVVGQQPNDGELGEIIAGMLETAGFEVTRDPITISTYRERIGPGAGMQAYTGFAAPPFQHPWVTISQWVLEQSARRQCVYPEQDALHSEALVAPEGEEQAQKYRELEELFVGENACVVPLFRFGNHHLVSNDVDGFTGFWIVPDYFGVTFR